MQLVKIKLFIFVILFLTSCIGPLKEFKYQVEDSLNESNSLANNPTPLEDVENKILFDIDLSGTFDGHTNSNIQLLQNNNLIFYTSSSGIISAINLEKNEVVWIYKNNNEITAGLSGNKANIYYVDIYGYLYSLNIFGNLNWKVFVGEVFSPPLVLESQVVIKNTSGKLVSSSLIDGSELWTINIPSSTLSTRSSPELNFSNGYIYVGGSSGKLIAIDSSNGSFVWETSFSNPRGTSELDRSNEITSNIIIDDLFIFCISSSGNIAAINKIDGNIIWSRALSSLRGISSDDKNIFVTHSTGTIYKLSKETNKVIWRNVNYVGRDPSRTFIFGNVVIFSDFEGYLHFLNINDGKELARQKISDKSLLKPVIYNDKFFLVSLDGNYNLISINTNQSNINNVITENKDNNKNETHNEDDKNVPENENSIIDSLIFWD
jgi:outer membrane protein assembly factor BamB